MDIKVVKNEKNIEIIRLKGAKSLGFHKTTGDGDPIIAKVSNVVLEKMGGLDKVIARAKKINPKLNVTIENAPAPAPEPAPAPTGG